MPHRLAPRVGLAVGLTLVAPAGMPALTSASPAAPTVPAASVIGSEYVALGDSFTADWGVDPVATDQPSTGCRQSTNDYPHQVAANLGLKLTDVSCAGAETKDMTGAQTEFPDGQTHPPAPPQFDALKPTTQIVTVGIGGNDFGFSDIAGACAVNPITGYVFGDNWPNWYATCRAYYNPSGTPSDDSLRQRVTSVVAPRVQQTIAAIKARSPKAAVFFVDYLALAPDRANAPNPSTYPDSCYSSLLYSQSFPFGGVDTVYLAQTQAYFNQTLDAVATAAGATVVSTYTKSLAHSPCYGTADPWMNGITTQLTTAGPATTSQPPPTPTTTPAGSPARPALGSSSVKIGSLHPNLEGAIQQSQSVTFTILQTLTGETSTPTATATSPATTETPTTSTTPSTSTTTSTTSATSAPTSGTSRTSVATTTASPLGASAAGTTPPARAAARAGLAETGGSSGLVFLVGAALVAVGLLVLLLRRGLRRPSSS